MNLVSQWGNTNNYPLQFTRRFAPENEVVVVLDHCLELHDPACRYDAATLKNITFHKVRSSGSRVISALTSLLTKKLLTIAQSSSLLILNGNFIFLGAIFAERSWLVLTGSDLTVNCCYKEVGKIFGRLNLLKAVLLSPIYLFFVFLNRQAVRNSAGVSFFVEGIVPDGDKLLRELRPHKKIVRGQYCDFEYMAKLQRSTEVSFADRDTNRPLRIVFSARIVFESHDDDPLTSLDYKNPDLLVKAMTDPRVLSLKPELVFIEKGRDVSALKLLIEQQGVEHLVTWRQEMDQRQFHEFCLSADIIVDNLGTSTMGMAVMDMLAAEKKVICNAQTAMSEALGDLPFASGVTPTEIADAIMQLASGPGKSELGPEFIKRNFDPAKLLEHMKPVLKKPKID